MYLGRWLLIIIKSYVTRNKIVKIYVIKKMINIFLFQFWLCDRAVKWESMVQIALNGLWQWRWVLSFGFRPNCQVIFELLWWLNFMYLTLFIYLYLLHLIRPAMPGVTFLCLYMTPLVNHSFWKWLYVS